MHISFQVKSKLENNKILGATLFKCIRQSAIMELLASSAVAMDAIITVIAMMATVVCILSVNNARNHHISLISSETLSMGCPITELSQHRHLPKQHKIRQTSRRKVQPEKHYQQSLPKNKQWLSPKRHHKLKRIYKRHISAVRLSVTQTNWIPFYYGLELSLHSS